MKKKIKKLTAILTVIATVIACHTAVFADDLITDASPEEVSGIEETVPESAVYPEEDPGTEETVPESAVYPEGSGTEEMVQGGNGTAVYTASYSKCGPSLEYEVANQVLTFQGLGEMTSHPWQIYSNNLTTINFIDEMTSICDRAFQNSKNLRQAIVLPSNLRSIGASAFSSGDYLTPITSLELNDKLETIGASAFYKCSELDGELKITKNVKSIGNFAFYGCSKLDSLVFETEKLTEIPSSAFYSCGFSGKIEFPSGLESIGYEAFKDNVNITELYIPLSLAKISTNAFDGTNIKKITYEGSEENWRLNQLGAVEGFKDADKEFLNKDDHITVKFETNCDKNVDDQIIEYNSCATEPVISNPGQELEGWYKDADFTEKFDFSTMLKNNVTLYAKWIEKSDVRVVFDSNGGSDVPVQEIKYGTAADKPADPVYDGYTFDGWYSDWSFKNAWNFNTPVTEDTVLYAKWTKNSSDTDDSNEESKVAAKNLKTLSISSGKYKVTISMNSSIPSAKTKREVLSKLSYTAVISTSDGSSCGISIKKVKATKPKRGYTKVTFKLRGSGKEERKAVKALNKSLKKIPIVVGS